LLWGQAEVSVVRALLGIAAALLALHSPAQARSDQASQSAVITASGLVPPLPSGPTALDGIDVTMNHVSFGRAQDIIGAPIDFARMPRPAAAGGKGISRLMGGIAVMPSRLPLAAGTMTSRFGMRHHPILGMVRGHSGVDFAAPTGSPVYATAPGQIAAAGWNGGLGLFVAINHGGGMQTRYGHLSRLAVADGQIVPVGAIIGYVGSTGLSTGPHLHYEVRMNGAAINPVSARR
jgi:murein DD-endopeptidase MepM/ murein hydrolase activator NlpD